MWPYKGSALGCTKPISLWLAVICGYESLTLDILNPASMEAIHC